MKYALAAAGTGGHVYPALAVGEALTAAGIAPSDVVFIGGDRLEASAVPAAGFPFEALEVRGLTRGKVAVNLGIPRMLLRARARAAAILHDEKVRVVLGFGNYITVPVALAARQHQIPFFVHEQNAHPGLANRLVSRWAERAFVSFPDTPQLRRPEFTGNPLRSQFDGFDRAALRPRALARYGLEPDRLTLGVFGGSLGARAINDAVSAMLAAWNGPPLQVVHLVGENRGTESVTGRSTAGVRREIRSFEDRMDLFYAAVDFVIARAGGGIAEVLATATPAILIPGGFGSGGHQMANADYAARAGAAVVVPETELARLGVVVAEIAVDSDRRLSMATAARRIARPDAAHVIARYLMAAAHG